ncbi:CaiB/BaiF CoA transferase family protein [Burkholderia guangdongensis]|uniref:CaiB/BaiF CoA transferase family protein n=1 Tax=Burkholderia guangdongensis TaxID=1792500 RepID=UPI0015C6ABA9|nr:CaiB/BaiF CoA-transferase family protein [Burkholderia guangdongensis]
MTGPLKGIRVVEMVGIGPGPFCGMMLADMGADVIRVDRPADRRVGLDGKPLPADARRFDVTARGKRTVALDLKSADGVAQALALVEHAHVLIEGFRPGVMERLGLGPDVCLVRNPALVYGRMTGWGQHGPLAHAAGHDLNYIAISGMLGAMGRAGEPPAPPLNLVGDYGGGAMMLAFGVACALVEARASGKGQVIDAAMSDGAALLGAMFYGMRAAGHWSVQRGANLLDGAAPFYDTYACADGKLVSIGSLEPAFYAELLARLELDGDADFREQMNARNWPVLKRRIAAKIATRTRAEWVERLEGTDVCFAPVLDLDEASAHPHNVARRAFVELGGVTQPAPAPRFSRTVPEAREADREDSSVDDVLAAWRGDGRR